ncbi:MAG: MauE/DoxX family redox-associated membrane protein [Bacteroidota bacterium]|nr:MauE/DoxX family redox-associated membrane protein [Bacteroidota bacterium]
MSRKPSYTSIITFTAFLLGILFIYTASSKLMHLEIFQLRLERMPQLSPIAHWIAWLIPFTELVIAGLLLIPKYRLAGIYTSLILLGIFTGYIILVLQTNDSVPCSCGGVLSALGWRDHILLNACFMAISLIAIILNTKQNRNKILDKHTT